MDRLKAEVQSCCQEVEKRDIRNLKGLEARMKELKFYEIALKGQGCDSEVKGYKKALFDALTETISQTCEEIAFCVHKSKWQNVEELTLFLDKTKPILESSDLADEHVKRDFLVQYKKTLSKIRSKAEGITSKWDLIESFDLKSPTSIEPMELVQILDDLDREELLLEGKLFASHDFSKAKAIQNLKARIYTAEGLFDSAWKEQDYKTVLMVMTRLNRLSQYVPQVAADSTMTHRKIQQEAKNRLESLVQTAKEAFEQALSQRPKASMGETRNAFHITNASLENIQKVQKVFCLLQPGQVFKLSWGGSPDIISLMQIYLPLLIQ